MLNGLWIHAKNFGERNFRLYETSVTTIKREAEV